MAETTTAVHVVTQQCRKSPASVPALGERKSRWTLAGNGQCWELEHCSPHGGSFFLPDLRFMTRLLSRLRRGKMKNLPKEGNCLGRRVEIVL